MNRALGHFCAHTLQAKLCEENLLRMVRWVRRHCPPDTGFDIQTLAVWNRARYLSVTEAPYNTEFCEWMGGGGHFCFFQTAETGKRASNSSVKGSGANCTTAPAHDIKREMLVFFCIHLFYTNRYISQSLLSLESKVWYIMSVSWQ